MNRSESGCLRGAAAAALAFWLAAGAHAGKDSGLEAAVLKRATEIGTQINTSGGYRFDGDNDCYGFMRRVWNPLLAQRGARPLPVADFASRNWRPLRSWTELRAGDVLATHQGHRWGKDWHGALFVGLVSNIPHIFDNSYGRGAMVRAAPAGLLRYYYRPTHELLAGSGPARAPVAEKAPSASDPIPAAAKSANGRQPAPPARELSGEGPETAAAEVPQPTPLDLEPAAEAPGTIIAKLRQAVRFVRNLFMAALEKGSATVRQSAPPVRKPAREAPETAAADGQQSVPPVPKPAREAPKTAAADGRKATPPPRAGGIFGVNIDPANPSGFPSPEALREIGAQWVRLEWKAQKENLFYDRLISRYRKAGVQVLLLVDYASVPGSPQSDAPDAEWEKYIEIFALGAGGFAAHYKDGVDAWQIWNEADLPPQPGYETYVRPRLYAVMLQKAAKAIRRHSSRPIVTSGMASGDHGYLKSVQAAGGIAADAVAVHPYGQRAPDGWPSPTWGFGDMSTVLKNYLGFGLPLWITEIGTDDGKIQADYLENVYRLAARSFKGRVQRVFWFCWSDGMVSGFGLLDSGGRAKPSWERYRAVVGGK